MPMTVIVTRDVAERVRGFLASIMPEPAPGVYVAGHLSKAVRERAWAVISGWREEAGRGSIVMFWKDEQAPGGIALEMVGVPPRSLADLDGVLVSVW